MHDELVAIQYGLIHHGKLNDRVYAIKVPSADCYNFITTIEKLAEENRYGKIIAKVPDYLKDLFILRGYGEEAKVSYFYQGESDCFFLSKYMDPKRKKVKNKKIIDQVLRIALKNKRVFYRPPIESGFVCKKAEAKDIQDMTGLYQKVFASYPFPIHECSYIEETMKNQVMYFGVWQQGELAALASSEIDWENKNAEMTDFAVAPEYRGQNISSFLLQTMEEEMKRSGILTVYTIARAVSHGMNCAFSKNGYQFSGTLFNNTHISGSIESMNVWYKIL